LSVSGAASGRVLASGLGVGSIGLLGSGVGQVNTPTQTDQIAAAVWNYQILPGVSARQMLTDIWQSLGTQNAAQIAAAVLSAAEVNPIHANVKEVNDYTVDGTGTDQDPWGPA
jgi:hypothetical protein